MELFLEIHLTLQQKMVQKLVASQLQLSLSVLAPWSRTVTAVSLELLLPAHKATEGI